MKCLPRQYDLRQVICFVWPISIFQGRLTLCIICYIYLYFWWQWPCRNFKEEVLDPAYGSGIAPISNGFPSNSNTILPLSTAPTSSNALPPPNVAVAGNLSQEKAKRSYTRKPAGGPKAKKVKTEPVASTDANTAPNGASQSQIGDHMPVQKRKRDRFKGMFTRTPLMSITALNR